MKQKLLIIVNPRSGVNRHKKISELAARYIDTRKYDYTVETTKYAGHSVVLAQDAVNLQYDVIAVAGGDGSVNEVSQALVHSQVTLAVIPMGSGNGLARHLKLPLNPGKAMQVINKGHTMRIDTGVINGKIFVSNTGLGFVSSVVQTFNPSKERGFIGYSLHTIMNYLNYKSTLYNIQFNNESIEGRFFMLNICNTNQFGYEARIAPKASITDGKFDVVMIKEAPLYKFPYLLSQMFTGTIKANDNVIMKQTSEIVIHTSANNNVQLDGELLNGSASITAKVLPLSLNIIVPGYVK